MVIGELETGDLFSCLTTSSVAKKGEDVNELACHSFTVFGSEIQFFHITLPI